jgi:hypothetical protein
MIHYKLEYLSNAIGLRITNNSQAGCSLAFVGGFGLIMFLIPILTILLLSIKITIGSVLACILARFIILKK